MKRKLLPFIAAGFLLMLQTFCFGQKPGKNTVKKFYVLPVYLSHGGLPFDTAVGNMVKEAFTRHKVKLINYSSFDELNKGEVLRVATKFRARADQFGSEGDVKDAISKEQHFVCNLLTITFNTNTVNDTLLITGASWEATPSPPNIYNAKSSGKVETVLTDTCCSLRDNIYAIVDKILYSKWLQ